MADEWADFRTPQGDVPATPQATGVANDEWQAFRPQAVNYDSLAQTPDAVAGRLQHGQTLGGLSDRLGFVGKSLAPIWQAAKEGNAAGQNAEAFQKYWSSYDNTVSNLSPYNPLKAVLAGTEPIIKGLDAFNRTIAGVVTGAGAGIGKGLGMALVGGGEDPGNLEGFKELGMNTAQIATTLFASPPGEAPLVAMHDGRLARIVLDPATSKAEAKVVGAMPTPLDFKAAASAISGQPQAPDLEQHLLDQWNTYGTHPAEVVDLAKTSPIVARDLSAARSPVVPLPDRPSPQFIKEQDDAVQRVVGQHYVNQREMLEAARALPSSVKDPDVQKLWQRYKEGDPTVEMPQELGKQYNDILLPLAKEADNAYDRIQTLLGKGEAAELDPNYVHRMPVGKTPPIDSLMGVNDEASPIKSGIGPLSRDASSLHERKFFALENPNGERQVVAISGKKVTALEKGKAGVPLKYEFNAAMDDRGAPIARQDNDVHKGDHLTIDGNSWFVKDAYTREITEATGQEYHENALASTMLNVLQLRAAENNIYRIQQMRSTDEWQKYTTTPGSPTALAHPEWRTPDVPMFRNDVMDPKLANMIEDLYAKRSTDGVISTLEKINDFAIGSLFYSPIRHVGNVGMHWIQSRGWDNLLPAALGGTPMGSVLKFGAQAIREVATQGPLYRELVKEGSSMMYIRAANRNIMQQILTETGTKLTTDEEGWGRIAKAVGMAPINATRAYYQAVNKSLWAASDVFMMQRVLELKEKGMGTREAIAEAEKYIPNYRPPHEIAGYRSLKKGYFNPLAFAFSRYHWNILEGYSHMARDLAVGNAQERFSALGSLLALGVAQTAVMPALSAMVDKATGNENIRIPAYGPAGLMTGPMGALVRNTPSVPWPKYIKHYYNDPTASWLNSLAAVFPLSPIAKIGVGAMLNMDAVSGRKIAEPSDVRNSRWGRVGAQEAEHTAQTLVAPYSAAVQATRQGKSLTGGILEQFFGVQDKTEQSKTSQQKAFKYQDREAKSRAKKPTGPIESLGN